MIRVKCVQFIITVSILVVSETNSESHNLENEFDLKDDSLPRDFANFVKGLDKMVFKSDSKKATTLKPKDEKNSKRRMSDSRRSNIIRTTQNAAMRDMLMMKLVSYYEDKYNVEQSTTHRTIEPIRDIAWRTSKGRTKGYATKTDKDVENTPLVENLNDLAGKLNPGAARRMYTQDVNTLDQNMQDPNTQSIAEVVVL